jgi:hypothetical protein
MVAGVYVMARCRHPPPPYGAVLLQGAFAALLTYVRGAMGAPNSPEFPVAHALHLPPYVRTWNYLWRAQREVSKRPDTPILK